ncbi:MAG: flagellar assembly protein A [Campylobacterota bacterium]
MGISPIITKTDDIAKTLKETAYKYKIPTAKLDFKLLEYDTLIKTPELNDWSEIDEENEKYVKDEKHLIDERVEIKQTYEIEIFDRKPHPVFNYVNLFVGANREKSKVVVVFEKGSKFKYSQKIEDVLRDEIDKKLLKSGYLMGYFDKKEDLNKLFAKIKVNGGIVFKQKMQIVVKECIHSRPSIDDKLILNYQEQANNVDQYDRVDYSKRGYALAVKKDDVVLTYIKPQKGINGRDCRGKAILAHEPQEKNKPTFNVSDKIEVKEDDDKIEYIALESGFITFKDGKYDIGDELEVDEINFKSTGSVEAGLDKDVKLNVADKGEYRDAVGVGMTVEAQEINIEGSIASSSLVRAQIVKIGGQTHQKSKVYADKAEINVHKGYVKAQTVHVTRLERGIIEADEVTVGQAIGGEIKAKKIKIEIVNSNTKLFALDEIIIEHLKGEDNTFTIDAMMIKSYHDEIEKIQQDLQALEDEYENLQQKYQKKKDFYDKNKATVAQIKKQLDNYKQRQVKPPSAFLHKLKQYQTLNDDINSLNADLTLFKDDINAKNEEIEKIQAAVFNAKIICHDKWSGHNEVIFKLISPTLSLREVPKGKPAIYTVKDVGDDEYEIHRETITDLEDEENKS